LQSIFEEKEVKLSVVEFTNYVINWWDQLVTSRRYNGDIVEFTNYEYIVNGFFVIRRYLNVQVSKEDVEH
jgi:hypothetical protein